MRITGPILSVLTAFFLTLFFLVVSTETMAQSGGSGGGFGRGPSGSPRGGQPGAYRMQRVYGGSLNDPVSGDSTTSQPRSQSPGQPSTETSLEPSQPSLQLRQQQAISREKRRQQSTSSERRYESHRSITDKYEKLRKDRHQEYWDQKN